MKVLFVCNGNVARSQIAEAVFNRQSSLHQAVSAGTAVEQAGKEGQTIEEHSKSPDAPITPTLVLQMMSKEGFDLSLSRAQ